MIVFFRYLLAIFCLALSIAGFTLFEYWKLVETDSRYRYAAVATGICFCITVLLFAPIKRRGFTRCLKFAIAITVILGLGEFGYLKWKSRSALNQALAAKGRCESIWVMALGDAFDGEAKTAQDVCRLRMLQNELGLLSLSAAEDRVVTVGKLLQNENRLSETSLVVLLSTYSSLESKRNEKDNESGPAVNLEKEFSLLEGELSVIQVYTVAPFLGGKFSPNMETLRVKKMVELATLGKTLAIITARTATALSALQNLSKENSSTSKLDSGELSLLEMRAQKIRDGYNQVIKRWNLPAQLESLNVNQTYPSEYEKVRNAIDVPPL